MIFMTTLFVLYCNNTDDEIMNSLDYYQLYNETMKSPFVNGKYLNIIQ